MATFDEIRKSLTGITLSRAIALMALAKSKKKYPDTDDIRRATGFESTRLGGIGSALTKIKINQNYLLKVRPIRINRNTTQYIWDIKLATRKQVIKILEEFGIAG